MSSSQAFLLQSYWLQDHLITLGAGAAMRISLSGDAACLTADRNDQARVHYSFDDFSLARTPPPNVASEIMSYSAVLRWPQKLLKLPAGTDLSVFYNQSANFTPSGGRVNPFNEALASPQGDTKEYGFNLSLLKDKLSLRVNWFETRVTGQSFSPAPLFNTAINNAILQRADAWGVEANINPHLAAQRNADIELLFSPLPANFRQLYNWGIVGTAPSLPPRAASWACPVPATRLTLWPRARKLTSSTIPRSILPMS
jgi:hypothetical protein